MPLVKAVKAITGAMKGIGLKNETVDKIHQSATDVLRESDVLDLPDRFNDAFADQGWIATQSFGMEAMRRAVELHLEGNLEGAEQEILAWFNYDNINLFAVNGSKRFDVTGQRWYQLREALRLTFEERYWSAVPLILIACDGLAVGRPWIQSVRKGRRPHGLRLVGGPPHFGACTHRQFDKGCEKDVECRNDDAVAPRHPSRAVAGLRQQGRLHEGPGC